MTAPLAIYRSFSGRNIIIYMCPNKVFKPAAKISVHSYLLTFIIIN